MGSNFSSQSSTASGSFSIDPNGNISPIVKTTTSSSNNNKNIENVNKATPNETKATTTTQSDTGSTSAESQQQARDRSAPALATLNTLPPQKSSSQPGLNLEEADAIVSRMKAKYKPNLAEMAGKNSSLFEEVERNLISCYQVNKNQPLNCSKLSQEYQKYVRMQRNRILKQSNHAPLIMTIILMFITCLLIHITTVQCYGVMSVDLGGEWMKVGLVAPSVPMDIVLNSQSQRKTAMAIAFTNGERYVGDSALDVASKYPERTFTHFLDLVGKTIQDESVIKYKQRFPYADIVSHEPNSTSIVLNHPQGIKLTPLELIAMMLQHAHDQVVARLNSNEPANDVVITVPPFFNEIERRVVAEAAKLAGLNLLRLTNVNSAFALSYGIFRHKDYQPEILFTDVGLTANDNRTSVLFFDQGATHTSVTLADYHLVEQIDPITGASTNESLPTITIRGQVYDRFLGGFDMQLRLRDHIAKQFAESTKIDLDRIYKRGRSISKLLKESAQVKRVLSANTDHLIRVENVIDDRDLKLPITRKEFEDLNEDLLTTRITSLIDRIYELPNINRDDPLESVIIVGGNTRTPKIQQVLLEYFKLENLGRSVNADEGAALAALYQAASLGRGFRVKKFVLEEFGEERRRFDPSKVITTTTTVAPEVTSTEASTIANETEAITANPSSETTEPTSTTTETPTTTVDPLALYSASELRRIGKKLADLREQDFLRLQRLSLRNSLESLLSEGRERLNGADDKKIMEKRDEIQKTITETYDWLEEGPLIERDNVTLLADKYTQIYDLINPRPPTTTPPPPPTNSFDPSNIDLSSVFNNDTLSILNALNFTNPFASKSSNEPESSVPSTTTEPRNESATADVGQKSQEQQDQQQSTVVPEKVVPGPVHTEL